MKIETNEYVEQLPNASREFLTEFRKTYSVKRVIDYLEQLQGVRVLIIGETILDEYHHVAAIGKPPKGNHIAARFIKKEVHAGGVLACANHMANFCKSVDLLTVIGRTDNSEKFIRSNLKPNVNPIFFYQDKTLIKRRFIDHAYATKLFEVYENEESHLDEGLKSIMDTILRMVTVKPCYDLVVVLDYGHNLFDEALINTISGLPVFLAVNAQTNTANYGYNLITKYPRADYFCLDEWEMRLAYHDRYGDLSRLMKQLQAKAKDSVVCVTRGHMGATSFHGGPIVEVPVFSDKVVDTTGAGDAFLAITAPCAAKGFPIELMTFIGNAVGAMAVEYLGNKKSIEADALHEFIETLMGRRKKISDE